MPFFYFYYSFFLLFLLFNHICQRGNTNENKYFIYSKGKTVFKNVYF